MARQSFEGPSFDAEDEKPLDPAVLRVQARLRRLMLIAGLTLGLGIIAVFAAILYRIATYDTTGKAIASSAALPTLSLSAMGLPATARLVSTALDGNRLALTYAVDEGSETVTIDLRNGAVLGRLRVNAK
jgi:hypothetical protein